MATVQLAQVKDRLAECESLVTAIESGGDLIEWNGTKHPPAMLLAYMTAILHDAMATVEVQRMTCFGIPR